MRLVYTFEDVWKAAQRLLIEIENLEAGTPNAVIRGCRDAGLLSDEETAAALGTAKDRNLFVHIYNEQLAEEIFSRLPGHIDALERWLEAMRNRIENER